MVPLPTNRTRSAGAADTSSAQRREYEGRRCASPVSYALMVRAAVAGVVAVLLASCSAGIGQFAEFDEPRDEPRDGMVRIRGTLEDSETDTGRAGELRAYRRNAYLRGQPLSVRPTFAGRKALKISWEETFPAGVRVGDVLLGLRWHD